MCAGGAPQQLGEGLRDEAAGEARGQGCPAQIATVEETMEAYLRVASPDIPALFPRTALSLSLKPGADAYDLVRMVDGYGAEHKAIEEAEADYRARREEAKVWKRERDEVNRQVQEFRALQARKYCDDIASRVSRAMKNDEAERLAELKRVEKEERM